MKSDELPPVKSFYDGLEFVLRPKIGHQSWEQFERD